MVFLGNLIWHNIYYLYSSRHHYPYLSHLRVHFLTCWFCCRVLPESVSLPLASESSGSSPSSPYQFQPASRYSSQTVPEGFRTYYLDTTKRKIKEVSNVYKQSLTGGQWSWGVVIYAMMFSIIKNLKMGWRLGLLLLTLWRGVALNTKQ